MFQLNQSVVTVTTEGHVMNRSAEEALPPPDSAEFDYHHVVLVIWSITTAVAVLALIENIIALFLHHIKRNSTVLENSLFRSSLSVADALVSLSWILLFIVLQSTSTSGNILTVITAIVMSMSTAGLWSLFGLALHHHRVVQHGNSLSKAHVLWTCLFIWVTSVGVNMTVLASVDIIWNLVIMCVFRLPPCFGTIALYLRVQRNAFRSGRGMNDDSGGEVTSSARSTRGRHSKRTLLLLSLSSISYIIFIAAFAAVYMMERIQCSIMCVIEQMYGILITQAVSDTVLVTLSALNPWIHTFLFQYPCSRSLYSRFRDDKPLQQNRDWQSSEDDKIHINTYQLT